MQMNDIITTTSNCQEWNMLPKQNVLRSIDRETDNTGYMARQISVNSATTKHHARSLTDQRKGTCNIRYHTSKFAPKRDPFRRRN
jgi:hypothetical protein